MRFRDRPATRTSVAWQPIQRNAYRMAEPPMSNLHPCVTGAEAIMAVLFFFDKVVRFVKRKGTQTSMHCAMSH